MVGQGMEWKPHTGSQCNCINHHIAVLKWISVHWDYPSFSSLLSIAVTKHSDQYQHGKERVYVMYNSRITGHSVQNRNQVRNSEAGGEPQDMEDSLPSVSLLEAGTVASPFWPFGPGSFQLPLCWEWLSTHQTFPTGIAHLLLRETKSVVHWVAPLAHAQPAFLYNMEQHSQGWHCPQWAVIFQITQQPRKHHTELFTASGMEAIL